MRRRHSERKQHQFGYGRERRMESRARPYRERPVEFRAYGEMRRPHYQDDYDDNYRDNYRMDYQEDYQDNEYMEDLHDWIDSLKKDDKFGMSIEQVIQHAKTIGANFNDYSEEELYAIYLANVSDYGDIITDPTIFIRMAINFMTDKDSIVKGSEKVCEYLYTFIMED
jgi:hypothetical protein